MGGLHLGGVMERIIPDTVDGLRPFRIPHIITGHCTGWRALHALADAFGDAVSQSAVGTKYTFDAEHYLSLIARPCLDAPRRAARPLECIPFQARIGLHDGPSASMVRPKRVCRSP